MEAAAYEFTQQNRRLVESADKAKLTIADQARADILSAVPASKPALAGVARTFEQQCEALRSGSELYFLYRHLSGISHPGIDISRHIVVHENQELHVRQPPVETREQNLAVFTVACSLIWAHRAFAEVEKGKTDKPRLAKLADRLGIPRILYLKT